MSIKYNSWMIIFILLSINQYTFGQSARPNSNKPMGIRVSGKVVDASSNSPIEFASVALVNPSDSSIVKGDTSQADGRFFLISRPGRYFVRLDFISYNTEFIGPITLNRGQKNYDLGTVALNIKSEMLDVIEVRGEKSRMEFKLDKKVFNVGQDIAAAGGSATDVLENIPAVTVDIEGNVSLRGSQSVRILIDGRPSGLVGISGTDALKQLSAEMIEKIEVITNPSVRYEAEGEAGIINIVLKKNKAKGLNGGLQISAGNPFNNSLSSNFNYRTKKVNYFGSIGLRHSIWNFTAKNYRENYFESYTKITDQNTNFERGRLSGNIRFGADYMINDKNSLTGSFLYKYGTSETDAQVNTQYLSSSALDSLSIRKTTENGTKPAYDFSLMYKKKYDKKGKSLTSDIRYSKNKEDEQSDIFEQRYNSDTQPINLPIILKNETYGNQESFTFQLDFINPLFENGKMEVGLRSSYKNNGNNFIVSERLPSGTWVNDSSYSNNFIYIEKIHAAYGMYGDKYNKFSYQIGLRYEYSDIETKLEGKDLNNIKQYGNFFPSLHLTYEMQGDNSIQLSYSKRVRRPRSHSLNPFNNFINSESIRTGNPDLNPEFTTSIELGNVKNFDTGNIYASLYMRHSDDVIQRISETAIIGNDTVNISYPTNLSSRLSYGIELSATKDLKKWWRSDVSFNYFYQIYNDPQYGSEGSAWRTTWNNNFYTNVLDLKTMLSYRSGSVTAQGQREGMFYFDMSASKDVFKKKGTVSLRVRDIFGTRKYKSTTLNEDFYSISEFRGQARSVLLSFSYRINQKSKSRRSSSRRSSSQGDGGGFDF